MSVVGGILLILFIFFYTFVTYYILRWSYSRTNIGINNTGKILTLLIALIIPSCYLIKFLNSNYLTFDLDFILGNFILSFLSLGALFFLIATLNSKIKHAIMLSNEIKEERERQLLKQRLDIDANLLFQSRQAEGQRLQIVK